ncbi:MAG: hypothetical protein EA356_03705 [Geminicoccaceae bacterium]|nr:MAG: hypothetical protein EA356_03705 [Geminicoccaceae bacterium]
MRLGAYQGPSVEGHVERALATVERVLRAAAAFGSDVVVFPELFTTGYALGQRLQALAEPADGPTARALQDLAATAGVALVTGFCERSEQGLHNAALAIDRCGTSRGCYRKIQLFGDDEASLFEAGDALPLVSLAGHRVGLLVCYDVEFAEWPRQLVDAGAEAILVPTAQMAPFDHVARTLVRARALENAVPVVYANYCGREAHLDYVGLSAIVGADGKDLARAGPRGEALLLADTAPPPAAEILSTQHRDRVTLCADDGSR